MTMGAHGHRDIWLHGFSMGLGGWGGMRYQFICTGIAGWASTGPTYYLVYLHEVTEL